MALQTLPHPHPAPKVPARVIPLCALAADVDHLLELRAGLAELK